MDAPLNAFCKQLQEFRLSQYDSKNEITHYTQHKLYFLCFLLSNSIIFYFFHLSVVMCSLPIIVKCISLTLVIFALVLLLFLISHNGCWP